MRRVIGFKNAILLVIIALSLFSFSSCSKDTISEDVLAMEKFMFFFEEPNDFTINALQRYNVSEREIYYYFEWVYSEEKESDTYEVILIYDPETQTGVLRHISNFEHGLYPNVKLKWDEIKDSPDKVFSQQEILDIKQSAIDSINWKKSIGTK